MSPELKDLLTDAAREPRRHVDVDDIHRRGRRARTAERLGGAAFAAVLVAGVAFGVNQLNAGTVEAPIVGEPEGTTDGSPEPADPTALRTLGARDLGADVLASVDSSEGDGRVQITRADGTRVGLAIDTAAPSRVRMVADDAGGFSWQPTSGAGGSPPILHVAADGEVSTVVPATVDETDTYRLVGGSGLSLLVEHRSGEGFDTSADLLSWWVGGQGSDPEVLVADAGGWEAGVGAADNAESTLYSVTDAGWAGLIVAPPDREPFTIWEGGESKGGVYPLDVEIGAGQGYALIDDPDGDLLFVIDIFGTVEPDVPEAAQPRVTDGWPIPVALGDVSGDAQAVSLSVEGQFVLVNRQVDGEWIAPIVYDTQSGRWSLVDAPGRAILGRATAEQPPAPACLEDTEQRNAAPAGGSTLDLYASCSGDDEFWSAYRLSTDVERTGDPVADAQRILGLLFAPLDDQADADGYSVLRLGQSGDVWASPEVALDGDTLIVDFDWPSPGVGAYGTTGGSSIWHTLLAANLLQLDGFARVELHGSGTCDGYSGQFESEGCIRLVRGEDEPWLGERPFD